MFVCGTKSGVWILLSCLSDRKASSMEQRGGQHQSAPCLISVALHIPLHTGIQTGLCTPVWTLTNSVGWFIVENMHMDGMFSYEMFLQ